MNNKKKLILFLIVFLGTALRLSFLDRFPIGFTPDEAAQGYTAYSILKTGKDEWGVSFPLSPRSFGDYKPPLYTYLTIPSVAIFGLNEFSTRLPAAIFGSLAILVMFFFTKKMFEKQKRSEDMALLASLLLAVSPWHIQLSRGAFEASLLVFFIPLGIWAFLKAIDNKSKWLAITAALSFSLSVFTYHSAKFFVFLLIPMLFIYKRREIFKSLKIIPWFIGVLAIFGIIFILASFSGGATRLLDVTIFNPTGGWGAVSDGRFDAVRAGMPDALARVFNNKLSFSLEVFGKNFFQYFSFKFLFTEGPSEGFYGMYPGRGLFYLFELGFILSSIYYFLHHKKKGLGFLLTLLVFSALPAVIAKGPGYAANRAIIMLPFWILMSSLGGIVLWEALSKRWPKVKKIFLIGFGILLFSSVSFFAEDYLIHSPVRIASSMRYGLEDAVNFALEREAKYEKIVMSRSLSEPQAYVMFYKKIDPTLVQEESLDWLRYEEEGLLFLDQLGDYKLENFEFRGIHYPEDKKKEDLLIIAKPEEFPVDVKPLKTISYPDGKPAILIVESLGG